MSTAATNTSLRQRDSGGGQGHGQGHVHFNPDQVSHHDLEILVEPAGPGQVRVHLGFLQVGHVYEVDVAIAHRLGAQVVVCDDGEGDGDNDGDCSANLFVRLKSHHYRKDEAGAPVVGVFRFELFAHKERLLRETLVLRGDGDVATTNSTDAVAPQLAVHFHARVLGKLKGTPALKNGIRCVGMRSEDDEGDCFADWPGCD